MTKKQYRFFYHFRRAENAMTIHFQGRCLLAKDITCGVKTETKWNKQQPYLVIQGFASNVEIINNKAYIS